MHLEVPYQGPTWHWDCGAVGRSRMLAIARSLAAAAHARICYPFTESVQGDSCVMETDQITRLPHVERFTGVSLSERE